MPPEVRANEKGFHIHNSLSVVFLLLSCVPPSTCIEEVHNLVVIPDVEVPYVLWYLDLMMRLKDLVINFGKGVR